MTTQALLTLIATVAFLVVVGITAADRLARRRRDPHDVVPVYSIGSAWHVLALVDRLERDGGADDAAAFRHLAAVEVYAGPERSHGTSRHRKAAVEVYEAAGNARVARHLPPGVQLDAAAARRARVHLRAGGRPAELGDVVECSEHVDLGGLLGPDRRRLA